MTFFNPPERCLKLFLSIRRCNFNRFPSDKEQPGWVLLMREAGQPHDARKVANGLVTLHQSSKSLLCVSEPVECRVVYKPVGMITSVAGLRHKMRPKRKALQIGKVRTVKVNEIAPHTNDVVCGATMKVRFVDYYKDSGTRSGKMAQFSPVVIKRSVQHASEWVTPAFCLLLFALSRTIGECLESETLRVRVERGKE